MAGSGVAAAAGIASQLSAEQPDLPPIRSADSQKITTFKPTNLTPPPLAIIALNRIGFGPRPGDIDDFNALGATDTERLTAYVDQQLDPDSIDDSACDALIAAGNFATIDLPLEQLWIRYYRDYDDVTMGITPRSELRRLTFLRAIYSKRQLFELLTDFWHNHFNVHAVSAVESVIPRYDRDVIRPHVFGNFRQLLEAVAKSTSMLYYLDNYTSSSAGPNENYARELFELHTLGAENYLGADILQTDVPGYPDAPIGYVDNDVYEATRCFTGWSISNDATNGEIGDTGQFYYRAEWHDRFQKTVMGQFIPPDQEALQDGLIVLDALAAHPGTARYISRKLCRRLISDSPPETLVESAAALFLENVDAPDQIAQVVRHILLSDQFQSTWGEKAKRPLEHTISVIRAMDGYPIVVSNIDTDALLYQYSTLGQQLFAWPAPNGYPDVAGYWLNSNMLYELWRTANWLVDRVDTEGNYVVDLLSQMPPELETPRQVVDFWIGRLLGRTLPDNEYQEVLQFFVQGNQPDFPTDLSDIVMLDRIRSLVALIFCLPSQLWR